VYTTSIQNNASIFNFSSLSGRKVNLFGALGRLKLKIPCSFQKHRKKTKYKLRENGKFQAKSWLKNGSWKKNRSPKGKLRPKSFAC